MFDTQLVYSIENQCEFDTTTLSVAGYFLDIGSVDWNFDDTASSANTTSGLEVSHVFSNYGIYQVSLIIYTDTGACGLGVIDTLYDTIQVIIDPLPQISLGNDTILCEGDSLALLNNNALFAMTYLWSDSTTNEFLQIIEPDTYWVQTSTVCGVAYDTIIIDSILPAIVNFGPDSLLCIGDTVVLDATVAGGYYSWQDNSTDSVFVATTTGTYSVIAGGICNTAYDTINLYFSVPVEDQLPPDTTFCDGETATFTIQADSATFVWSTGSTSPTISVQSKDSITVEITNACGVFHDSVSVVIDYPLNPYLGADTVLCLGDTHVYRLSLVGEVEYNWHNGATVDTFQVTKPGNFWVEVKNTCGNFSDSVNVDYDRIPELSLPSDTIGCDGQKLNLKVSFSRSSYLWSTGITDSNIIVTTAGNYSVTATNLCGLDSSDIDVKFDFPLTVDLGPTIQACQGEEIEVGFPVPNEPKYQWSNGLQDSSIFITNSGRYHLTITNQCGSYSDDVYAFFEKVPIIGFPDDTVVCDEIGWFLKPADAFDSYEWQDGQTENKFKINKSGTYWLTAWSDCGEARDTVLVKIVEALDLFLGNDTVLCEDMDELKLNAYSPGASVYDWNTGSSTAEIVVTKTGIYSVTIHDDFDCATSDEILVDVCPHYFYLPNSFSPNGDGLNETFHAEGEFIGEFEMLVFDRWGNLVFQSSDINSGWDGKRKGKTLPIGTYAVRIKYTVDGENFEQYGQVSLMR